MNVARANLTAVVFRMTLALAMVPAAFAADAAPPAGGPAKPGNFRKGLSLFDQGCREAVRGNLPEADRLFARALETCPLLPGAHVERGRIRMARKDPAGALEHYLKAKEAYRLFLEWKMNCTLVGKGARTVLGIPDAQNFYFRHRVYGGKGDFATHRTGLDAQSPAFVGQEGFAREKGVFSFQKNPSETLLGMAAFAKLYPDLPESKLNPETIAIPEGEAEIPALFYLYLGAAYLHLGRPADAERELMVGIAKDPSVAELYMNLSVARLKQGDYPGAANACRAARQLGYDPPPGYLSDLQARGGPGAD
ncbi:MAG: tetratricopeptide repeat protein [Acidobacteria bacterium]|nr:tetratricopeptide repeat protein [Acidobacteriota bacterium]